MRLKTQEKLLSVLEGNNDDVFKKIFEAYVGYGTTCADVTFAKGMFWRKVDKSRIRLIKSDRRRLPGLDKVCDCRQLKHINDNSLDCLVFDPPFYTGGKSTKSVFASKYTTTTVKDLLDTFDKTNEEFARCLKPGGILIVKIQDIVSGGKQNWLHIEVANRYRNFYLKDLFVYYFTKNPFIDSRPQQHARKIHAYFMVLVKTV